MGASEGACGGGRSLWILLEGGEVCGWGEGVGEVVGAIAMCMVGGVLEICVLSKPFT